MKTKVCSVCGGWDSCEFCDEAFQADQRELRREQLRNEEFGDEEFGDEECDAYHLTSKEPGNGFRHC